MLDRRGFFPYPNGLQAIPSHIYSYPHPAQAKVAG